MTFLPHFFVPKNWRRNGVKMESKMTVDDCGTKRWFNENGECHRTDGPAVIFSSGSEIWYQKGFHHRDDGPAVILSSGMKKWYRNGNLHCTNGPAVVFSDGEERWIQNGIHHREDGPAVIDSNGKTEWWLNNYEYSFTEWADKLNLDPKQRLELVMKWNPE